MSGGRSFVRKTAAALLVALVASFALSAPADAAPKKAARVRAKHSSHAATGAKVAKPAAKRKAAKTKATAKKARAKAKSTKRTPTTKPR